MDEDDDEMPGNAPSATCSCDARAIAFGDPTGAVAYNTTAPLAASTQLKLERFNVADRMPGRAVRGLITKAGTETVTLYAWLVDKEV